MSPPDQPGQRWEGDSRGFGSNDARALATGVRALLHAMGHPNWVAEEPEKHLLPQIQEASANGSLWKINSTAEVDGVFIVYLEWLGEPRIEAMRSAAFALVGAISEFSTHVRQVIRDRCVDFDVVVGMLDGDVFPRGHGHQLRLRVEGQAAAIVARALRKPEP